MRLVRGWFPTKTKKPFSDGVYIELRGTSRLIAEGIDSLLTYECDQVTVGAEGQRISFSGSDLELRFLSEDRIVLEGYIREIRYEEGG